MTNLKRMLLVASCVIPLGVSPALANQVTYSGYSVLNDQNVTISDAALNINETAGSGQITLTGVNGIGGILQTWCIDITHSLQNVGGFTTGMVLLSNVGTEINALLSNGKTQLGTNSDASAALQVAIWDVEYGSALTVTAAPGVQTLASTFVANVANGTWKADPTMQVAVLSGNGSNQDQAYLTPVPEPASMAILATGLLGAGLIRRKSA